MSVSFFYPPGCATKNEQTCPQTKIDEICGEDEDDIITSEAIRAPFFKALLSTETLDDQFPGYTRHKSKRNNDREFKPGTGKCYNDYLEEHAVDPQKSEGLRRWVRENSTDPYRYTVTSLPPPPFTLPPEGINDTNMFALVKSYFEYESRLNQTMSSLNPYHISKWNVSEVTDMQGLFMKAEFFNGDLSKWNVSNVTNMALMFQGAKAFNQPIGEWKTSNVTSMAIMFEGAEAFNQPIGEWDTSNVKSMAHMFHGAKAFNQPIGGWDTSNVTRMRSMFQEADVFNQPIGGWDTSNVEEMSSMFDGAKIFNQSIGEWDTSNVTNMAYMFHEAKAFNQPIGEWDVSNVTNIKGMFIEAEFFNGDISEWNVSNVTDMRGMFKRATAFERTAGPFHRWQWKVSNEKLRSTNL
jgi:surface protein